MSGVAFPEGFRLETLNRAHPRRKFRCNEPAVDEWLRTRALQHQKKHLSVTRVLLNPNGTIAGYYTLATGQIDFRDLPPETARKLTHRALPVAVLAWLGVSSEHQGQGLGKRLLAQALHDCHEAGKTFAFVAVILDCINDSAKAFYRKWDFEELPGHQYRLFLSSQKLAALMETE